MLTEIDLTASRGGSVDGSLRQQILILNEGRNVSVDASLKKPLAFSKSMSGFIPGN